MTVEASPASPPLGVETLTDGLAASGLLADHWSTLTEAEVLLRVAQLEELSRVLDAAKVVAAAHVRNRCAMGRFEDTDTFSGTRSSSGAGRKVPGCAGFRARAVAVLMDAARICAREAARRVKVAEATEPLWDPLSQCTEPAVLGGVAAALGQGRMNLDQAAILTDQHTRIRQLETAGTVTKGQAESFVGLFTGYAAAYGTDELQALSRVAMGYLDPDGHKPSEADLALKEGISF